VRLFPASGRGAEAWGVDTVKPLEGGQGMAFLGGGALGMTAVRQFALDRCPEGERVFDRTPAQRGYVTEEPLKFLRRDAENR